MPANQSELDRRVEAGLEAIRANFRQDPLDGGAATFASHHIAELDPGYWHSRLGTSSPDPAQVFSLLVLDDHWSDDDDDEGMDVLDYSLPGDVSDYLLSVTFDESGEVEHVEMES